MTPRSRPRTRAAAARGPSPRGAAASRRARRRIRGSLERDGAAVPLDVPALESFTLVASALRRPSRILDVGCGTGRLAARLQAAGHDVTALDVSADSVAAARRRGVRAIAIDFHEFDATPFDAVVFGLSLHHIGSLPKALARARRLLRPRGLLIADEFGRERMDRATAAWFYGTIDLLEAAGTLKPVEPGHHGYGRTAAALPRDPLERWRRHHAHDPPLHTGRRMLAAITARFDVRRCQQGPHLFRYPCRRLKAGATGVRLARHLLATELQRIQSGTLRAAGIRLVARRP